MQSELWILIFFSTEIPEFHVKFHLRRVIWICSLRNFFHSSLSFSSSQLSHLKTYIMFSKWGILRVNSKIWEWVGFYLMSNNIHVIVVRSIKKTVSSSGFPTWYTQCKGSFGVTLASLLRLRMKKHTNVVLVAMSSGFLQAFSFQIKK